MINEDATFRWKGYRSSELSKGSHKKVWVVCGRCGRGRWTAFRVYVVSGSTCHQCTMQITGIHRKLDGSMTGENNPNYGKQMSDEQKKKLSESRRGQKAWNKGKRGIYSEETLKKMSEAHSNISEKTRNKMSEAQKGKTLSEEHRKKLLEANKGRVMTEEHKKIISATHKGKKVSIETRKKMSDSAKNKPPVTDEAREKMSEARTGEKNHFYGKTHSEETRKKISEAASNMSEETRKKMSEAASNMSEETRKKMSAAKQGIPYDEWESFAKESPYCPKFNEACRESNREKYSRKCFICGKHESDNTTKTGKQKRLSVHHVDMDKMQGCNGRRWRLIPTCIEHHGKVHSDLWMYRIIYLLENVH